MLCCGRMKWWSQQPVYWKKSPPATSEPAPAGEPAAAPAPAEEPAAAPAPADEHVTSR